MLSNKRTKEEQMQLFQTIQRRFELLGISLHQSMQNSPFNRKIAVTFFIFTLTIASYNVYLFRVAGTFWEYTINIYSNSATSLAVFCYVIVVLKMKKIFAVVGACESIINDSKWKLYNLHQVWIQMKITTVEYFEKPFRSWSTKIDGDLRRSQ